MKSVATFLILATSSVTASFFSDEIAQTLVSSTISLPYDKSYSCSMCIRTGNNFCASTVNASLTTCLEGKDITNLRQYLLNGYLCSNGDQANSWKVYEFCNSQTNCG
jgi:hypothetical protein